MKSLKQLQEERAAKVQASQALITTAETEKREFTEAENTAFDAAAAEIRSLDAAITRAKVVEETRAISAGGAAETVRHTSDQDDKDISQYSYLRAINAKLEGRDLTGVEAEMHQEGVKEYRDAGLSVQGNLIIPQRVLVGAGTQRRALTATGQTTVVGDQGGVAIQTSVGSLIERLRAALVMGQMGCTMLDGLVGNIDFPRFKANDAAAVKPENGTAGKSSPTFDKVSISPNRVAVSVDYSRQFLAQSSLSVESMLRDDLAYQIAALMDAAGISTILTTAGIGSVVGGANGAAPTWKNIVAMETAVAVQNAAAGTLGYLLNPSTRGALKTTQKFAGANAMPIWDNGDTPLNGYKAGVTTQITNAGSKGTGTGLSSAIFGNFRDHIMGQWGGVEMLVNPYTRSSDGIITIDAWTFFDTVVRRVESFAAITDLVTA
jgi:HK97 family phage major capsid protein